MAREVRRSVLTGGHRNWAIRPGVTGVRITDAGHFIPEEQPAQLVTAFTDFSATVSAMHH